MSNEQDKLHHSERIHQKEVKIAKQVKIAKENGLTVIDPHRFAKHNAMNCGDPKCMLCSNPRKVWGEKTIQEKRNQQVELDNE